MFDLSCSAEIYKVAMKPEKIFSKSKTILLSVVLVMLGFLVLELMVRGAFLFTGRYGAWGYPEQNKFVLPYVGFSNRPDSGRDRHGFRLHGADNPDRNLEKKRPKIYKVKKELKDAVKINMRCG